MDQVCDINNFQKLIEFIDRAKENLSPDFLLVILGPTASGKTKLAVKLAQHYHAEIISADSRQVYRKLDIGTGKDLHEYQDIPYHLIDIRNPDDLYDVKNFKQDFEQAYQDISARGKATILCGGTGSYIQSILQDQPYSHIPKDEEFRRNKYELSKEALIEEIRSYQVPEDFKIDWDNHKRLVRALEIVQYLKSNPLPQSKERIVKDYLILGLSPDLLSRRGRIDKRLDVRLKQGLLEEVEALLKAGMTHEQLQWFGLEYKYASLYLLGELDDEGFKKKLKTEIHRFAKRQMTYFRKMEKDGIKINWITIQV